MGASSQNDYTITNYSVNEGLPQSTIYSIIQDKRGFMWFATYGGGLTRFDGIHYQTYTKEDGLVDDKIYSLLESSKGDIWIGTRFGLSVFDGYEFKTIDLKQSTKNVQIRDLIEDKNGNIWIGTYGNGLIKFDQKSSIHTYNISEGLLSDYIYSIEENSNNQLLIGTREGINRFDGKRFTVFDAKNVHGKQNVRSISNYNENQVVYGSFGEGLCIVNGNEHECVMLDQRHDQNIMNIIKARNGDIWVATFGDGIFKITEDSVININFNNSQLSTNNILSLFEDNSGNIWVGTFLGGVCKISQTAFYSYAAKNGLDDPSVENIYQLKDGTIFITFMNGGLKKLDNEKISDCEYSVNFRDKRITSLYEDESENIWLTTDGDGLFKIAKGNIINYNEDNVQNFSNQLFTIEYVKDDEIWLGTYGEGLILLKNGKAKQYLKEYERGLNSNHIMSLKKDDKGLLWIATNGGGVSSYDGINFKSYELTELDFISVEKDLFGNIWFASNGGGVFMFNGNEFLSYTTKDGLVSNNANLMTFDDANNLWVGTERGINKIVFELKDTLEKVYYKVNNVESYSKEDGLIGLETNQGAVLKDNEGNLWFGTIKGISRYNPRADKFNAKPPLVQLTEIKLSNKSTDWSNYSDSIKPWNLIPTALELSYNNNNLTFEFVGINLNVPHGVEYKYRLEGLEEQWNYTARTIATYSNLSPGDYTFMVMAKNEDGVWQLEENATQYQFTIDKPIWLKLWFIVLIIILILLIVYFFIKRREAEIRKQNLKLEKTVNDRTIELKKEKENVEKINKEVEKKNEQILDSIQYAKKIQMAILPPDELVREKLPEFGIFYQAKDIVSGDFYWLTEENDEVFFATVDCTGHGVPGAFMSIVGYRLLELIISGYKILEPSEALDELHMQVLETLHKQKGQAKDISDGMDIALCAWNKKINKLKFAGAHNALYLIRDGELQEFEPNARPIGMSMMKEFKKFTQHEIEIKKGDVIYIFTDGFADQFGGDKFRKYYYQNFQKFLVSIAEKPMEEQRDLIEKEFFDWKRDYEQIDDVLVFGVKF